MGRAFSSHYLETVGVTAPWDVGTGDFSVSAWVRTTRTQDVAVASWAGGSDWWIGLSGSGQATFSLLGGAAVEPAATVNDGNWRLLSGCRVSGTMRVFVDGVLRATASSSGNSNPASTLSIGRLGAAFPAYWIGDIAEVAFWQTVGLSDAEMAALGKGYSPRFIRRQSLTAYWPIIGNQSPEPDLRNGYNATLNGPPTKTVHPRIIYPVGLWSPKTASGGSTTTLTPDNASLTVTGFAPSLNTTLTPDAGSPSVTGNAPVTGLGVTPAAAAAALTGFSPALNEAITPASGSLTLTGNAPILDLVPGAGSLVLTGFAPVLVTTLTPSSGSLTVNANAPVVGLGVIPDSGSLTITGYAPLLLQTIIPGSATLTITGYEPTLDAGSVTLEVGAALLTLTGFAPSVSFGTVNRQTWRLVQTNWRARACGPVAQRARRVKRIFGKE